MRPAVILLAATCVLGTACSSSAKSAGSTATTTTVGKPETSTTVAAKSRQSVFVVAVSPATHRVTVDPMKFLTGAAATSAYHKANPKAPPGGPDNDYYIVNRTKDRVVMTLDPAVHVRVVQANGTVNNPPVAVSIAKLASYPALAQHPFWITVERGKVTQIDEQFVP